VRLHPGRVARLHPGRVAFLHPGRVAHFDFRLQPKWDGLVGKIRAWVKYDTGGWDDIYVPDVWRVFFFVLYFFVSTARTIFLTPFENHCIISVDIGRAVGRKNIVPTEVS